MERIGEMILLVGRAPHSHTLADLAKVNRLLACALRHLAPVAIADPAEVTTEVADHHLNIRAFVFVAHSVHPCNTGSTAPQCAVHTAHLPPIRHEAYGIRCRAQPCAPAYCNP